MLTNFRKSHSQDKHAVQHDQTQPRAHVTRSYTVSPARAGPGASHKVDHISFPGIQVDRTHRRQRLWSCTGPLVVRYALSRPGPAAGSRHALNQVGCTGAVSCGLLLLLGQALLQSLPLLLGSVLTYDLTTLLQYCLAILLSYCLTPSPPYHHLTTLLPYYLTITLLPHYHLSTLLPYYPTTLLAY